MFVDLLVKTRSYRRFDSGRRIELRELAELVNLTRFSPSAANLQPLKFILSADAEKNSLIYPALRWAGYLADWDGPDELERPTGYIIILGDKVISDSIKYDDAIAALTIMLGASEKNLGGCIIGAIDRDALAKSLKIDDRYDILLVCALGKPAENVVLEEIPEGASIKYYRDANGIHCVPKRMLEDIILD